MDGLLLAEIPDSVNISDTNSRDALSPNESEFRICFLGAANPALTNSKNWDGSSIFTFGFENKSILITADVTLGLGVNAWGGTTEMILGHP